jgi:hypothetical protein
MVLNFYQRPKTSESLEKFKLLHNTGLNLPPGVKPLRHEPLGGKLSEQDFRR